jgi:uncharacterized protein YoxC
MTLVINLSDVLLLAYIGVAIFLIIVLYYIIKILINLSKMVQKARETVEVVNEYIWKPINYTKEIYRRIDEVMKKMKKKEEVEDES